MSEVVGYHMHNGRVGRWAWRGGGRVGRVEGIMLGEGGWGRGGPGGWLSCGGPVESGGRSGVNESPQSSNAKFKIRVF